MFEVTANNKVSDVRIACSRRSDSGARAKGRKKRGETGEEGERTPVKLILKSPRRLLKTADSGRET